MKELEKAAEVADKKTENAGIKTQMANLLSFGRKQKQEGFDFACGNLCRYDCILYDSLKL